MRVQDYSVQQLEVGYESGADRLVMWLPVVVRHVITPDSPLASWLQPGGTMADADSCILVVVRPASTSTTLQHPDRGLAAWLASWPLPAATLCSAAHVPFHGAKMWRQSPKQTRRLSACKPPA